MLTACLASLGLEQPLRYTEKRGTRPRERWQGLRAVLGLATFLVILIRFQPPDPRKEMLAWRPHPGCLTGSLREPPRRMRRMRIKARKGAPALSCVWEAEVPGGDGSCRCKAGAGPQGGATGQGE